MSEWKARNVNLFLRLPLVEIGARGALRNKYSWGTPYDQASSRGLCGVNVFKIYRRVRRAHQKNDRCHRI